MKTFVSILLSILIAISISACSKPSSNHTGESAKWFSVLVDRISDAAAEYTNAE